MGHSGHISNCVPPTSNDHIFHVRTLIRVFLDSTESPLSLESDHMPMNDIWCPHISENLTVAQSVQIAWL